MSGFAEGSCRAEHERAAPAMALDPTADCHLGDLHVLEITFRPGQIVPLHAHHNARLVYVFSGDVAELYDNQQIVFDQNSFSFHPAILRHRNETGTTAARALIIELCTSDSRELLPLVGADVDPFSTRAPRLRSTAIELSRALATPDHAQPVLVEAITLDLVARAGRMISERAGPRPRPQFLDEAKETIALNPARCAKLSDVASSVGTSARMLADAFRIHEATTFKSYVQAQRVAAAQMLLERDDANIADIALACGFSDQSHLTRVFRSVTGLTPSVWRDQARTSGVESF
jgi:AraC family transcriptional regulator